MDLPQQPVRSLTPVALSSDPRRWRLAATGLGLGLLWLGLNYAFLPWHVGLVDREWRQQLLQQAVFLAQAVEVDLIRPLTFTAADYRLPEFHRLCRYFRDYLPFSGARGIYTMRIRDGQIVFGPESYAPDDPQASPAGTVYQQPSKSLLNFFRHPEPFTAGPHTDEYGTFISAYAPVFDPVTGELLLAVGLDVEAQDWQAALRRVQYWHGVMAGGWVLVLGLALWLWSYRSRWPRAPVLITLLLGLALTGTATLVLADWQHHVQKSLQWREAGNLTTIISQNWRKILDERLLVLREFFANSEEVTAGEFQSFSSTLLGTPGVTAALWLPTVAAAERASVEAYARSQGLTDFALWEPDPEGQPRPATARPDYSPVFYCQTKTGDCRFVGFDLASDPQWRARLAESAATGLTVADPMPPSLARSATELLFCQPVYRTTSQGRQLLGWVAMTLDPQELLPPEGRLQERNPYFAFTLERPDPEEIARLLGQHDGLADETPQVQAAPKLHWPPRLGPKQVYPLFGGGQVFFLVVTPQAVPLGLATGLVICLTAGGGLLLTGLAVILVYTITRHSLELEDLVQSRTAALRERENYLATLLDILGDGVFITTFPGREITYVNRAGAEIFGWPAEALLHQSTRVLYFSEKEYEAYGRQVAEALAQSQNRTQKEIRFKHRDGSLIWGEANTVLLREQGDRQFLVSVVRDITARKKLTAEREQLLQQLLQAQKMEAIGRLASSIAHDFNNLLGMILGQMELMLLNLPPASPWREQCEVILEAGQRAAELTRQLLVFTRPAPALPQVLDLNTAIGAQLKLLNRLLREDIVFSWLPAPEPALVRIDPQQLQQVLSNLLINARDAIRGAGRITLETAVVELDEEYCRLHLGATPGPYVLLTVSDTGCGMDRETLDRIFEPFFTTKPPGQGTGLGLATVYGIVRQWGGFIHVYSEVGQGSTFKIYLPRHDAAPTASTVPSRPDSQGGQETILVVEDDLALLQVSQRLLEHLGYTVLSAPGPIQALKLAQDFPGKIHLLLTDVMLPGLNGKELFQRLAAQRPDLKVLYTSGYSENVISANGILPPETEFLSKPYSLNQLAAKVQEVLTGH